GDLQKETRRHMYGFGHECEAEVRPEGRLDGLLRFVGSGFALRGRGCLLVCLERRQARYQTWSACQDRAGKKRRQIPRERLLGVFFHWRARKSFDKNQRRLEERIKKVFVRFYTGDRKMSGAAEISKDTGISTNQIHAVFESIFARVARGESVKVKGFGTFSKKVHKGRTLVTPLVNEGKPIQYEDSHYMKFHQSLSSRQRLKLASMRIEKGLDPETGEPPKEEKPKKKAKEKAEPSKAEAAPKRGPG